MFSIGKLAAASHCKIPTIRYYEDIGLLPTPRRSAGNQRIYAEEDLLRLRFIRHSRELGFDLKAIAALLQLSEISHKQGLQHHENSHQAEAIAKVQLEATYSRIARLQSLAEELEQMLISCDESSAHQCQVLEVLANHELCQHH